MYFHRNWEFHAKIRPARATEEILVGIARDVAEGLRRDALHASIIIGLDQLSAKKGFDKIVDLTRSKKS